MSIKLSGGIKFENSGMFGNNAAPVILIRVKNVSNGTLERGDVVIWDHTPNTSEVPGHAEYALGSRADVICATTTASANHEQVMGMVSHSTSEGMVTGDGTTTGSSGIEHTAGGGFNSKTIADDAMMWVQIWGPTDALKVDGTANIANGSPLATKAAAGEAKLGTGAGIFARALQAYTADTTTGIDAFISCFDLNQRDVS